LRIGIDIRSLVFTRAGISRYTENLIKALLEINRDNRYTFFCNTKSSHDWSEYKNVSEAVIRFPNLGRVTEKIWEEKLLPGKLKNVDVFHSPRYILPKKKPCKFTVTVHDLAFKKFPHIFLKETVEHANEWVKFAVKQADRIITVSHNTRKDLLTLFDTDEDKIRVIYEGVSSDYHPIRDPDLLERLRRKYALPEKFILFVGTIEPRKNLVRLLEAFNKFKKNKSAAYRLVIAGGKGWLYDDVFETVEKLELQQDVIFTGYIPESELPLMYNLSDLFIYPSLYEGFGLPLLEAMACGIFRLYPHVFPPYRK
jgi:glycosyltransferase involved in cell wall biosynthesis